LRAVEGLEFCAYIDPACLQDVAGADRPSCLTPSSSPFVNVTPAASKAARIA
jgi:hypothetical protein